MTKILISVPISQLYLFLGKCFSYPEERFCAAMKETQAEEELRTIVEGLPFEVNFKGISSWALSQDEFGADYIGSFDINPACPLYESEYRTDELSRRDILEELLRFYEHFDIKLSDQEKDYPDHLAVELEFMAFLAQKEAGALEQGKNPDPYRRAQMDFLERHLSKWVHQLDESIQKKVNEPFYRQASTFMTEFIRRHLSYLLRI